MRSDYYNHWKVDREFQTYVNKQTVIHVLEKLNQQDFFQKVEYLKTIYMASRNNGLDIDEA